MSKITLVLLISFITSISFASELNNQGQATAERALKSAQGLLVKAIDFYDGQPEIISDFIISEENRIYLKNTNRLNIIKKSLINSRLVNIKLINQNSHLYNQCRSGTHALVIKPKKYIIYLCPITLSFSNEAITQVLVHELIHTSESSNELNECETSFSEYLVMLFSDSGNPYDQEYYKSCGFFKKIVKNKPTMI